MSTAVRLLTYDDLLQTPEDGKRYEIIAGELYVSASPGWAHQEVSGELYDTIKRHVRRHQLGKVYYAPVDVRLSPHDIVEPDLLFIRQDRLHIYKDRGAVQGAPELVVEIISPSSRRIDPGAKKQLYARSGIPEYWLVDPATRQFQLFILLDGRYEEVPAIDGRLSSAILPGLVIDLAALFAVLD